jgi:hypothetical protein
MPFLSDEEVEDFNSLSSLEKSIYKFWTKLQERLIKNNSKYLTLT